jgi:NitT/TauT family transport system substrate-binding protein
MLVISAASCSRPPPKPGDPLRLGHFPNITHAQALVGARDGTFARALAPTPVRTKVFNAGPAAMEALLAGELDVSYVGTSPALIAYVRSNGGIRVVAGAVSGGSVLIAKGASSPAMLKGKRVAAPQLGNSQDVALRTWLKENHLSFDRVGADVKLFPLPNSDILGLFRRGQLDAAWVPEPWGARLMSEGGGILVDERDLWDDHRFPTTVLVATTAALQNRRDEIEAFVRAHVELTERWSRDPEHFQQRVNEAYGALTAHPLEPAILRDAFSRLEPVLAPFPEKLAVIAKHLEDLGYLPESDTSNAVDSSLLSAAGPSR